jgi:hypothetical protein
MTTTTTTTTPLDPSSPDAPPAPKPWYASAGVWGALVTLAGSVLSLLKVQFDPALLDDLREWVLAAATLVGGGVALWGRLRASRRIGRVGAPPRRPPQLPPPTSAIGLSVGGAVLLAAIVGAGSGGCARTDLGPTDAYLAADRATFDAVAPEYRAYVDSDPFLDADQRERRGRTVDVWRRRLEDAERGSRNRNRGPQRERAPQAGRLNAGDSRAQSPSSEFQALNSEL